MSLYQEASRFLNQPRSTIYRSYEADKSLKSDPRQVSGLVQSYQRHKAMLSQVIKSAGLIKLEMKALRVLKQRTLPDEGFLMIHDLLLSKSGRINCSRTALKDLVLRNKTRLKAELIKYKIKHKITNFETTAQPDDSTPVRWFRINVAVTEAKAVHDQILEAGFGTLTADYGHFIADKSQYLYQDQYVTHLYGIDPVKSSLLTNSPLYKTGLVIIQDRASCFPAQILSPAKGTHVIDACAAPGNKTTHLASFVCDAGQNETLAKITAFERDEGRAKILASMVDRARLTHQINIQVGDFTQSNPDAFPLVTGIVVDPSCSGSGIFGRGHDEEVRTEADLPRLRNLSEFQFKIVSHAMKFPAVETVVYSTCSIHMEENEHVVERLLDSHPNWILRTREGVLPDWPRRGFPEGFGVGKDADTLADSCVRAEPKTDGGIGFFAACFDRIS